MKSKRTPFVLYIFILLEKTFSLNELSSPNFLKPSVDISFLSIKVLLERLRKKLLTIPISTGYLL